VGLPLSGVVVSVGGRKVLRRHPYLSLYQFGKSRVQIAANNGWMMMPGDKGRWQRKRAGRWNVYPFETKETYRIRGRIR